MAEEAPNSDIEGPNVDQNQNSVEATIELESQGGTGSACNNAGSSTISPSSEREKSLEYAEELMELGSKAAKERDYTEATDYYSRALEIKVAHFGELAPECVNAYYKYGCALLYKAQEEADPLGAVPKKEGEVKADSDKDGSVKSGVTGESSATSAASNVGEDGTSSTNLEKENRLDTDETTEGKDVEEDEEETDSEDVAEGDEDESDLDLAWKMLDVARAIVEKHPEDTMEKVDILSALAEVALEREDVETSLSDYLKALSILERLVEPDSRHIAELNFRICLCLEIGSKPEEAIPYCKKAISICISRLDRLTNEAKELAGSTSNVADSESDETLQHSPGTPTSVISAAVKESEIETLTGLSDELEKKLEDLHQLVLNKKSLLSDLMYMMAAKDIEKAAATAAAPVEMSSSQMGTANSNGCFESSTVSTAQTNGAAGVTHLGVVGRGVKRVLMDPSTSNSSPVKKPSVEPSQNNSDGNAS